MDENDELIFLVVVGETPKCDDCQEDFTEENRPVVFGCVDGGSDHIYHEKCLPEELSRVLMMKRTAAMN